MLYDYGVRTVIDLRSMDEIKMSPYQAIEGIEVYPFPLQKEEKPDEGNAQKNMAEMSAEEMAEAAGGIFWEKSAGRLCQNAGRSA